MGVEDLVKDIKPIKKLNGALFVFILLVAFVFDIIGLIPFLSPILFVIFILLIKVQLWLAGYHAGIIVMIVTFLGNFLVDTFVSIWFACTFFTITFYFFNSRAYKLQQKMLNNTEHELV